MPKTTAIVFLVSFLNPSALFDKHAIDLTDMFLHFGKHPFVLLVKQVLYLLPVSISDIHRHLQLVRSLLQEVVNMLIDIINLATDGCDRIIQFPFSSLILLNGRLQFKSGIDQRICGFVNVLAHEVNPKSWTGLLTGGIEVGTSVHSFGSMYLSI